MSSEHTTDGILRVALIVVAVIVLAPILLMAFMMPFMGMWGFGMMGNYGWSPLWGVGMMLFWLAVLAGGGYLAYRWLSGSGVTTDSALEELRLAYARGDISDEEFEERRRKLKKE